MVDEELCKTIVAAIITALLVTAVIVGWILPIYLGIHFGATIALIALGSAFLCDLAILSIVLCLR